jgi:GT2 family glycosyltransferase
VRVKASVVIPSYNAAGSLVRCLRSLDGQRLPARHEFEVVVVDDGSSDDTRSRVAQLSVGYPVLYLHKPRTAGSGRAAARNTGIAAATGDVVVMLDADQSVTGPFLAEHLRYHELSDDVVVLGPRRHAGPASDDQRLELLDALSHNLNGMATCWHHFFSCNASVRRRHLAETGGFDEGFVGWGLEDSELGYRLRRAGLAFAFNPDAVVLHHSEQVLTADMYREWTANLARFVTKHPNDPDVALQWLIDRCFNPEQELGWVEACLRFEYAVRAVHGRLPGRRPYETLEVRPGNLTDVRATIADRARTSALIVLDHTADRDLAAVVQCLPPDRDVVYFRRPDGTSSRGPGSGR